MFRVHQKNPLELNSVRKARKAVGIIARNSAGGSNAADSGSSVAEERQAVSRVMSAADAAHHCTLRIPRPPAK